MIAHFCAIALITAMPAAATQPGVTLSPQARIRSEINLVLELHNFLLVATEGERNQRPEYLTQINTYKQARELISDPRVWRFVNDAILEGPDIEAIAARAAALPVGLSPADAEGARKILHSLADAWRRFEVQDLVKHRRSLQIVQTRVLRRQFSNAMEPRIMSAVYDKMLFRTIDAPVTVYPVVDAIEVGVAGKTSKGYYLILPVSKRENLVIIEMLVHELIHILDAAQPAGSSSIFERIRKAASAMDSGIDDQTLQGFLHGLVAFNAGEMLRRFVKNDYRPLVDTSPSLREHTADFRPAYEGPWISYLDGKLTPAQVVSQMVAFLKAGKKS